MQKALKIGKTTATGSIYLFIGKTLSTLIMAIGTIILGRLMLQEEYGLYSIALMPSLMIDLFRGWGVNPAMTRYIAHLRAEDRHHQVHNIIIAGLAFQTAISLFLTLLTITLANTLASTIFHRPELAPLISIASLTTFFGSLLIASQSIFNGFQRMELNTLTMIVQSILKTLAAPVLVLLGYGALGATLGYSVSTLAAGVVGITILHFAIFKKLRTRARRTKSCKTSIRQTLKKLLEYGIPLSVSTILMGFRLQFYDFMIAFYCTDIMIGNYRIATNFATLLTFFTFPISTVLLPAFATLKPQKEPQLLKDVYTSSVKYAALLLVPATMAIMVLSKPMISTLFGEKWVHAPFFLTLYVTTNLFVVFGALIMGGLLTGLGETKMQMKLSMLALCFGLPLAFLLIPPIGVAGAILGTVLAGLPSMFYGLYWIRKHYGAQTKIQSSVRIFVASIVAATVTYLVLNFLKTIQWIRLTTGGAVFLTAYLLLAPLIGAVDQNDVHNLRVMLSGLGIISRILNVLLSLVDRVAAHHSTTEK